MGVYMHVLQLDTVDDHIKALIRLKHLHGLE